MTDEVETLVLEMLKGVRNELRAFRGRYEEDMGDLKARMASLEGSMVSVRRDVNHGEEVDARQQVSLDKIVRQIERLEKRLDLADAS